MGERSALCDRAQAFLNPGASYSGYNSNQLYKIFESLFIDLLICRKSTAYCFSIGGVSIVS